jgi:hypothetical protein
MIGLLVGLLLLTWLFGRTRGMLGGLVGGFLGVAVLIGMARTATTGELPALYSPGELVSSALVMGVAAAGLAIVAPYATAVASLGWGAGALLAALALPWTEQRMYALALTVHVVAAGAAVYLARARLAASPP